MIGLPCHYDDRQHLLLTPELLGWCVRNTGDSNLFVYLQRQVGTFVIGRWLDRPYEWFVDVLNLGSSLANFTRQTAGELRRRVLAPISAKDTVAALDQGESMHRSEAEEQNATMQEMADRHRGKKKIQVGYTGGTNR